MVHPQEQLSIEEITSPIEAQLYELCGSDLFLHKTLQPNSEVASSSNCCYDEQSSYNPITQDITKYTTTTTIDPEPPPPTTTTTTTSNPSIPIIFDDQNDFSESIDFTTSPSFSPPQNPNQNQFLNNNNNNNNNNKDPFTTIPSMNNHQLFWTPPPVVAPIIGPPPLPASYEDECMPAVAPYRRLRPSNSLIDPMMAPYLPSGGMNGPFSGENSVIFAGNGLMLGNELTQQEMEFQGDNGGLFLPDTMQRVFNCSGDLQALSSESQHLVNGGGGTTSLASEISSLDDPTFKVGKLSVEERKRKIHRYMKKRNERNFSKKIKYACRKTLADSRPRVRGRFAKNDELGELARPNGSNNEDDIDEDVTLFSNLIPDHQRKVAVKEEDDMDSSELFAHISGLNSFKCNYPIQSWI